MHATTTHATGALTGSRAVRRQEELLSRSRDAEIHVPGLGKCRRGEWSDWLSAEPLPIPLLGERPRHVALEGYDDDPEPGDFHRAIRNLLASSRDVLRAAEGEIFAYYEDIRDLLDGDTVMVTAAEDIWQYVTLGDEPVISRRSFGDMAVYVSSECACDWEPEHGLQIVLREGNVVTKVGAFDGHLSNADSFDDPLLEGIIYRRRKND